MSMDATRGVEREDTHQQDPEAILDEVQDGVDSEARADVEPGVPLTPNYDFANKVEAETGIKVSACYQCRKCTNGCPLTFAMDHPPDRIVRYLLLGLEDVVLHSSTIWVCSSCVTCSTRCPNSIDIAGLMDYLKQEAHRRGIVQPGSNRTYGFHNTFLRDIERRGRVHEAALMRGYMLSTGAWRDKLEDGEIWKDLKLGWALFRRGRLPLIAKGSKDPREVKRIFAGGGETGVATEAEVNHDAS